jgi:hypothetical protein
MDYYLFSFILSIVGFAIALSSLSWVVYNVYFWRRRILEKNDQEGPTGGLLGIEDVNNGVVFYVASAGSERVARRKAMRKLQTLLKYMLEEENMPK